ncbi:MAG: TIM barrel protein [Acidobacteria bacterium]|nr:TIM barrel protein [Acidobacteriota bacterium]
MNRRGFARSLAGTLLSSAALAANQVSGHSDEVTPFPLSVMLWTVFRSLPFEVRLEKVAAAGYKHVELVGEYQHWTAEDFERINRKRVELGISFDCSAGLKHGVGNPAERDALLEDLARTLPIMEKIGCPSIILMSGNIVPGMNAETQQQSCVDGLRAAAHLVEGKTIDGQSVRLLLENIDPEENPKYFLTSVSRGFEIVKSVEHPQVQFLYDFFHEQIAEGNLIEKLERNIQHVGLVHIADVPGRHEPGTGEINYTNIFRKLAELNYRHIAAMEFLPSGDPVSQLRSAREMVARAVAGRV